MNENGEDFVVASFGREPLCVMNEMKYLLCLNFVGNNITMVASFNLSEIWNIYNHY